jgi:KipI family sensor histidine kinase inhibitor
MTSAKVVVRPIGSSALLLEVDDPGAWFSELVHRREVGDLVATDIVPGARTVLIDGLADTARVADQVSGWAARGGPGPVGETLVEITVRYGGPDLTGVAQLWGVSVEAVVARMSATEFRVAFCGFAPGFAYLTGLPDALAVPRLDTPRARVPAGSVALAGRYAGIYPTSSPGGWRIVGRADATLFDVSADPPALLGPGTRVRLAAR